MPVLITMVTRGLTLDTLTATLMHLFRVCGNNFVFYESYFINIPATQVVAVVLYRVSNNSILQISSGILGLNEFWPVVFNC